MNERNPAIFNRASNQQNGTYCFSWWVKYVQQAQNFISTIHNKTFEIIWPFLENCWPSISCLCMCVCARIYILCSIHSSKYAMALYNCCNAFFRRFELCLHHSYLLVQFLSKIDVTFAGVILRWIRNQTVW